MSPSVELAQRAAAIAAYQDDHALMADAIARARASSVEAATAEQRLCLPCKTPGSSGKCWCINPCGVSDCPALPPRDRPGDLSYHYPVPTFEELIT